MNRRIRMPQTSNWLVATLAAVALAAVAAVPIQDAVSARQTVPIGRRYRRCRSRARWP